MRGAQGAYKTTLERSWVANAGGLDAKYLAAVDPDTLRALIARLRHLEDKEAEGNESPVALLE